MAQNNVNGFTANAGQMKDTDGSLRSDLLYTANAAGAKIYVRQTGISFCWYQAAADSLKKDSAYRMDVDFVNPSSALLITPSDKKSSYSNYFIGNVSASNVSEYGKVSYQNLWPNIDLLVTADSNGFTYKYHLKKGANPADIKLSYNGGKSFQTGSKSTSITIPFGNFINFLNPTIKILNASKSITTISSNLNSSKVSSLQIGNYNSNQEYEVVQAASAQSCQGCGTTVNTPNTSLQWSTYYGGSEDDEVNDVFVDAFENIYITGKTRSLNFPVTPNVYSESGGGLWDAFVAKFNAAKTLIFSTYIKGESDDLGRQIAINSLGDIYIVGNSYSNNLAIIATSSEFVRFRAGTNRELGFIMRIKSDGTQPIWSTYINPNEQLYMMGLAIDQLDRVYAVGFTHGEYELQTNSTQQEGSASFLQLNPHSGGAPSYIIEFNVNNQRIWATYYGGLLTTNFTSCTIDNNNNFIIVGNTGAYGVASCSALANGNIPVCGGLGAYQQFGAGLNDFFITKFSPTHIILWSTLYGGIGNDISGNFFYGNSLTTDEFENIFFVGRSTANIPGPSLYNGQTTYGGGGHDGVVIKFNASGQRTFASYLGGYSQDYPSSIKSIFGEGYVIAGYTISPNFPVLKRIGSYYDGTFSGSSDGFVLQYDQGNNKFMGSFIGGDQLDEIRAVGISPTSKSIILGGKTYSTNFDVLDPLGTLDYTDVSQNGLNDGFVMDLKYSCGNACRELYEQIITSSKVLVYPNPSSGDITFNKSGALIISVIVRSITGQTIEDYVINNHSTHTSLDLKHLDKGVYLLTVLTAIDRSTIKLIIQ